MKITLKNVKHYRAMSEETNCYSATIYVDGKKAGEVRNRGHGGCDEIYPTSLHLQIAEYAKSLPPVHFHGKDLEQDADMVLGHLLREHLLEQDLKRLLKKGFLFIRKGKLFRSNLRPEEKDVIILSGMPFDQALQHFRAVV